MRALIIVLICTASAIFAPFACAQSGGAGTAIVVLDGSGSMGGPLDGQTDVKFDMASRALLQLLPTAAAQSRTGLVTFGNRRKGDCGDADTAILPTSGNLDQFSSVFARIGPTGKGPLVHGVRTAAKSLPPDAPGTLIVIHDDMDNCRQDVCAAAADLAKISPKITVHVITISLDKTTSEKMSCLATATGGRVFEARDAASVESSLADALRLAGVIDASARPSTEVPTANVPAPIIEPLGPPSVRLSAGLGPEGLAVAAPVQWRILSAGTPSQVIKEATVPVLTTELPAGSYVIEARFGYASSHKTIEVADHGQTQARLSLDAANIKISSVAGKGSEALTNPVLTVSALGDKSAPPRPLFTGHEQQADLVVPAGAYRLAVRDGLAVKQQDITLAAGDSTPVDFALTTGRLELSSQNRDGGEPIDGAVFILAVDDPDAPQGRREVARSIAPRPSFVLPAGTYYVTAKLGAAETKERIAIGTGDIVKRVIALNGAWTGLSVSVDAALVPKDSPIVYRVMSKGKDSREIAHVNAYLSSHQSAEAGSSPADIFLPQGSYRFEAKVGRLNVMGAVDAEVVAGPKSVVTVAVAASELTVQPAAGAASSWNLRDGQGRVVQRSAASLSQKTLLVAPGRYLLRMGAGDAIIDKSVDLKPGERRVLPLSGN